MKNTTRRIAIMAMLTAVSVILTYFRVPIIPSAAFLEYETADVPILIGSFMFGPLAGVILSVMVSAIQAMTLSAQSGPIGFVMHVFATGAFAAVSGAIYKRNKSFKGTVIALVFGSLVMITIMVPLNLIFTPMYGIPIDAVKAMILPAIIPFNAVKAGLNSILTLLIFRQIAKYLKGIEIKG